MATSTNCNSSSTQCGCTPGSYTVVPPCPPSCAEVFNASCIVYTGTDLLCNDDTVISRNDYLDTVITKLVNYICSTVAPPASVVVGSAFINVVPTTDPVTDVTTYTVSADMAAFEIWVTPIITNQILAKVLAGPGIDVAADGVAGTVTISHEDTSTVLSPLVVNGTGNTFLNGVSFGFDTFGHVTSAAFTTGTVVPPNSFVTAQINADTGFVWGPDNNPTDLQTAEAPGDTLNFVAGAGIVLNASTIPSTDAIRITNTDPNVDQDTWQEIQTDFFGPITPAGPNSGLQIVGSVGIQTEAAFGNTVKIKNLAPNVDQFLWSEIVAKDTTSTTASTTTDTLTITGGPAIETTIAGDTLTINNGGVTEINADEGINVSATTGSVTVRNTGALFTTLDATIAGGAVTVPAFGGVPGAVDVSTTGISSVFMNVQLVTAAGVIVPHDNTRWLIKDMGSPGGPGKFTFENVALADGDYVLTITGNLQ